MRRGRAREQYVVHGLAENVFVAEADDAPVCRIGFRHAPTRIGDDQAFRTMVEHSGGEAQFGLGAAALGDVAEGDDIALNRAVFAVRGHHILGLEARAVGAREVSFLFDVIERAALAVRPSAARAVLRAGERCRRQTRARRSGRSSPRHRGSEAQPPKDSPRVMMPSGVMAMMPAKRRVMRILRGHSQRKLHRAACEVATCTGGDAAGFSFGARLFYA